MAKKKKVSHVAWIELREIQNIIGLARFAAEARRVLSETHLMADLKPELGTRLRQSVDAPFDWIDAPDCSAAVLGDIYYRLNTLLDLD